MTSDFEMDDKKSEFNTEQKNKPLPSGSGQLLRNCFFSSVSPNPRQTPHFNVGYKSEGFGDISNKIRGDKDESW